MRDLSPPQHSRISYAAKPKAHSELPPHLGAIALFVQKCASWLNTFQLESYTPEIKRLPRQNSLASQNVSPKRTAVTVAKKKAHRTEILKKAAGKAGTAVKKAAKAAVKTPAGRYAVIQGVIGIALLGMVYNTLHKTPGSTKIFEQRNVGKTAVQQISRYQFLPSPVAYVAPKAFNASTSQKTHANMQLDTWVTPWNYTAVSNDHSIYHTLSAFWLTVKENGYDMEPKTSWETWDSYYNTHPQINHSYYLTVSGDPDYTFLALSDQEVQKKHIEQLLQAVKDHNFDGIDIDYEALGENNQILFADFIRNLTTVFHTNNKKVAVTVEARIGQLHPMNWQQLSLIADEIRVMLYDYHSAKTDVPGSISPIGWLKETLDYAVKNVPKEKLVIGLGNYGYDWTAPADPASSWEGTGISFEAAMEIAKQKGIAVQRAYSVDKRGYDLGLSPYFTYTDENQKKHEVWFEDSVSIQEKLDLIANYNIKSVTFWSVGTLDPRILTDKQQSQ